jgi:hypothetical protein
LGERVVEDVWPEADEDNLLKRGCTTSQVEASTRRSIGKEAVEAIWHGLLLLVIIYNLNA